MLPLLRRVSQSLYSSLTVHNSCFHRAAKQSVLTLSLSGRSWKGSLRGGATVGKSYFTDTLLLSVHTVTFYSHTLLC